MAAQNDQRLPVPRLPPDVARIPLPTPFGVGAVNVYLLIGERPALVDTGPNCPATLEMLTAALDDRGVALRDIELVLVTHQHHDHAGLAAAVKACSGAEIVAMAPLARYLEHFAGATEADDVYARATMCRHGADEQSARALYEISRAMRCFGSRASVDRTVADGERVKAGDRWLVVRAAPGHSPTDTLFHDLDDGLLFAGDHLLAHRPSNPFAHGPVSSRGTSTLRAGDTVGALVAYLRSLEDTARLDASIVLPGHGPPFAGHREVVRDRVATHGHRANTVLSHLESTTTAAKLVSSQWPDLPLLQFYCALSEILGHLELLENQGRVTRTVEHQLVRFQAATTAMTHDATAA